MFSVLFEILPRPEQRDAYASIGESLLPELARIPGFVEDILYKSLTREGWVLALSTWRDEKSVIRWRVNARHHDAQEKGRAEVLADYRLRISEVTYDTKIPEGYDLQNQRLDETEAGRGTAITLTSVKQLPEWVGSHNPQEIALYLGFDLNSYGDCVSWDVFESIFTPGDLILVCAWKDQPAAMEFAQSTMVPDESRVRAVRVVRDYTMFDRRETPQYFPDVAGGDIDT
jgi:heme-degrading monooxygenase HmoA